MSNTEYDMAKRIMGDSFIGVEELKNMEVFEFAIPEELPKIQYSEKELEKKKNDYLLILAVDKLDNGKKVNIRNLIEIFGKDPFISEPCFYNQDWYDKEEFINTPIQMGWFLIRKNVYEDSRAVQPNDLQNKYIFPSAVKCVYAFFVAWKSKNMKLWYHDYVWCSDTDHNGDRIYVGKYNDVEGVNKNGFSIHRHLALRDCYGCVD